MITVNSDILAKVLFSQSFVKVKSSRNREITLSFTDEGKSCQSLKYLRLKYVLLSYSPKNNSRENV